VALIRLQKALALAGVASRRKSEEMIEKGQVKVNGRVIKELGTKVDPKKDRIEVGGKILSTAEKQVTVLMNKPRGIVCTVSDPEGRETVIDLIKNHKERLFPVGRLDFATSGALILTNDGALAYALTHPKHDVEKTYLLKVKGSVNEQTLEKWRKGVDIGDVVTRPAQVFKVEEETNFTWIEVTIKEGRNRQIRRMGEATGLEINKLKRVAFAGLTISGLKVGQYRALTEKELFKLYRDHVKTAQGKNTPDFQIPKQGKPASKKRKTKGWSAGPTKKKTKAKPTERTPQKPTVKKKH